MRWMNLTLTTINDLIQKAFELPEENLGELFEKA